MSKSRKDYGEFLEWCGFDAGEGSPDPLALLGVSEGIRETDQFEVFKKPEKNGAGKFESRFFVHGLRYHLEEMKQDFKELTAGAKLRLVPEHKNPHDEQAVAVFAQNQKLGFVPRYLARDFRQLLTLLNKTEFECVVWKNNHEAPFQNKLLSTLEIDWPDDFTPCGSEEYTPIPLSMSPTTD
ncbi:MAG: HIRAN domain-containing protein [Sumerlaeia bacterium]